MSVPPGKLPPLDRLVAFKCTEEEEAAINAAVEAGRRAYPERRLSRGDVLREVFRLGVVAYRATLAETPENCPVGS